MSMPSHTNLKSLARMTGLALLASIVVGIIGTVFVANGIEVNTSGDIEATAANMLNADTALHAKAHIALLTLALGAFVSVGLYLLLKPYGPALAAWALFLSLIAACIVLLGAVYAINAASIASKDAFQSVDSLALIKLQVLSDHTTFHLGLIVATASNAASFVLFLRSGLMPKLIAGWGLFASLFVITVMVARDYIPALSSNAVTMTFILSNLIALLVTGLYLAIRGVRTVEMAVD